MVSLYPPTKKMIVTSDIPFIKLGRLTNINRCVQWPAVTAVVHTLFCVHSTFCTCFFNFFQAQKGLYGSGSDVHSRNSYSVILLWCCWLGERKSISTSTTVPKTLLLGTRVTWSNYAGADPGFANGGRTMDLKPITGVWDRSPQRSPGAELLLGVSGAKPPWSWKLFVHFHIKEGPKDDLNETI